MTSEVGHDCTVRRPAELSELSPETEVVSCPQEESRSDSSSGSAGADTAARTTSGLASSSFRLDPTGNTMADRLKERCRGTDGEKGGDNWSRSVDNDDLASRENLRDCASQHQQQLLPVGRSQYHSIQQLSRPSTNAASGHHVFAGDHRSGYQLDSNPELYHHSSSQPSGGSVPEGRYFTKAGRSRDGATVETQGRAAEGEGRQEGDGTARSDSDNADEGSACTDQSSSDPDHRGVEERDRKSTSTATAGVELTGKTWSSSLESCQNGGSSTAVEDELEAKRARVEHIVRSMRTPPGDGDGGTQPSSLNTSCPTVHPHHQQQLIDGRRQRRKQFAPLQHQHDDERLAPQFKRSYDEDDDEEDSDRDLDDTWSSHLDNSERDVLRLGLQRVHDRLADMQKKYMNYLDDSSEDDGVVDVDSDARTDDKRQRHDGTADDAVIGADFNRNEILRAAGNSVDGGAKEGSSLEALASMLKAEISDSVGNMVDEIVRSFVAQRLKVAGGGGGGVGAWRHGEPDDGRLTPTHRSTMSSASSPDTHGPPGTDGETAPPPPLTPICVSTAVDLRFPVPPPAAPDHAGITAVMSS